MKTKKIVLFCVNATNFYFMFSSLSSTASAVPVQTTLSRGPFAYITTANNSVDVIDTATNNVTDMLSYGPTHTLLHIAVTPDGKKAYVANVGNYDVIGNISVIDVETNNITSEVLVGKSLGGLAITPDGKKAYVVNCGSNDISVVDTATDNVTPQCLQEMDLRKLQSRRMEQRYM